jgi:putative transposase
MKKDFYRQKLPHYQPDHATYFVTYRLAGSIPVEIIRQMRHEYEAAQQKITGSFPGKEQANAEKYKL